MREIRFRAWDEEKKEWIYLGISQMLGIIGGGNLREFYPTDSGGIGHREYPRPYKLTQFTGLKDKSGKDIYEGDLVKWEGFYMRDVMVTDRYTGGREMQPVQVDKDGISTVEFRDGAFRIEPLRLEMCEYEVIGNVYENPELKP